MESVIAELPAQNDGSAIDDDGVWIEALPARVFKTKLYGEVPVTVEKLEQMIANWKANVRGQEVATDFEHGFDPTKGKQASGWYRDFAIRPSSDNPSIPALYAKVAFTDDAKADVKGQKYKYFSLEWDDEYETDDGKIVPNVIIGGALTNRPVAKRTMPINFSEDMWDELDDDTKKEFSVALLDNRIKHTNESKEWEHSEPGTGSPPAPRTDEDGSDDPAIRGGWRRQTPPIVKELENTDSSTVTPPGEKPVRDNDSDNDEGGKNQMPVFELAEKDAHELIRALGLPVDADGTQVVEEVKKKFGELDELKNAVSAVDQEKQFAEKYPQYWAEHTRLMERDRENSARGFAETVSHIRKAEGYGLKDTRQTLSPQAKDKVVQVHKKFAAGTAKLEDFEECIKEITSGGIVMLGELGSANDDDDNIPMVDTSTAPGVATARKQFAEVINKVQHDNPEWDYNKCIDEAAKKYPDLAEAYKIALPA